MKFVNICTLHVLVFNTVVISLMLALDVSHSLFDILVQLWNFYRLLSLCFGAKLLFQMRSRLLGISIIQNFLLQLLGTDQVFMEMLIRIIGLFGNCFDDIAIMKLINCNLTWVLWVCPTHFLGVSI